MKKKNLFLVLVLAVCFVFVLTLVGCNKTQTDKPDTDNPVVAEEFTIMFDSDGGTEVATVTVESGKTIAMPDEPIKKGYTFAGWYLGESVAAYEFTTIPTGDITLTAKWTANTYTVKLNKDGGDCADLTSYTYGVAVALPTPTKTGYTFGGWYESVAFTGSEVNSYISATDTGDKTYYAKWTANKYTVTFCSDGGSDVAAIQQDYGTPVSAPTPPTKTGYTFGSWYLGDSATAYEFSTMPAEDITLIAQWNANGDTPYTVRHWQENIGVDVGVSVENEENYTLADTDNLTGATDNSVTPPVKNYEGFTIPETQTIKIAADGSSVVDYYYVRKSYDVTLNAGTDISSVSGDGTYGYGQSVTVSATADEGYSCDKWTGDFTTATFTMPAHDVTMTAIATANKYTVTFNSNGGTAIPNAEVTYNENYGVLPVPTKTGYTFAGWFDNAECTGEKILDNQPYPVPNDITLHAKWNLIKYSVTYVLDGGINDPENPSVYTIEDLGGADGTISLKAPEMIVKKEIGADLGGNSYEVSITSRSFEGWYKDSGFTEQVTEITLSLGTVTLYAKWSDETTTSTITASKYQRIDANGTANDSGEYILFGEYPQTKVTDEATISALGDYANNEWTSYGYYRNKEISNFMEYTDKVYNGAQYRGVYFTEYRPNSGEEVGIEANSNQDDNGYNLSTVYWFKYEPIKWRILNEAEGKALIFCDMAIDSQAYDYKGDKNYKNNYAESTIRTWLNETFYNTAFSDMQKELIQTTTVDNSVETTGYESSWNACANTDDKVFLLSYADVTNGAYGFNSDKTVYDEERQKKSTDYAKSQGCYTETETEYEGNCNWWLRSPYDSEYDYARYVINYGYANYVGIIFYSNYGVVPALTISLQ